MKPIEEKVKLNRQSSGISKYLRNTQILTENSKAVLYGQGSTSQLDDYNRAEVQEAKEQVILSVPPGETVDEVFRGKLVSKIENSFSQAKEWKVGS